MCGRGFLFLAQKTEGINRLIKLGMNKKIKKSIKPKKLEKITKKIEPWKKKPIKILKKPTSSVL